VGETEDAKQAGKIRMIRQTVEQEKRRHNYDEGAKANRQEKEQINNGKRKHKSWELENWTNNKGGPVSKKQRRVSVVYVKKITKNMGIYGVYS
jgi:hypothetical protein